MPATLGARAACERAPGPGAEHEAPPPLMHASLERVALARDVNGTRVGSDDLPNFVSVANLMRMGLELRLDLLRRKCIEAIESHADANK